MQLQETAKEDKSTPLNKIKPAPPHP